MTTIERRAAKVPVSYRRLYLRVLTGEASRATAIKAMCLECVGWERKAVTECTAGACPLYRHRPYQKVAG